MNLSDINREYMHKASALGLQVQCLADGDANATVAIVAEAPGPREVEMRLPLVGGSGKFLWNNLRPIGLDRRKCYITNVVKKQLVDGAKGKQGVSTNELSHWKALLDWELKQLPNLQHVFVLGGLAAEATIGLSNIERLRGSVYTGRPTYIVTYNPAFILRKPMLEPIFKLDCAKLEMVIAGRWSDHPVTAYYDPTPNEAIAWCDKMIQEAKEKPVAFDIEVISNETACVGLANDAYTGMCINMRGRYDNRWSTHDEARVRTAIQRVLRHASVRLIAQNGGFDCGWLWYKDRIKVRPMWLDTLLAHHTLYPTWPHNLGFLTAQYTTHPYYKDEKDAWREGGNISEFWEYNVKDCCITWACARALDAELRKQGLADLFYADIMRLQPYLVAATVLGNKVDLHERARLEQQYKVQIEQQLAALGDLVSAYLEKQTEFNPLSPMQTADLLFTKMKLTGKNASTAEENLNAIMENPRTTDQARLIVKDIIAYRGANKLYGTYITAKVDEDGRMRSDYKQYGVQNTPGRLSSSATLWGSGMNLQNQPELLRGMFIADPGYVYVYFDMEQAEARLVAWYANIPSWKHQYEYARLNPGKLDTHRVLAADMFKVTYDDVPTKDYNDDGSLTIRGIAKRCRHGLNYRMQAARLAAVTGMSINEASSTWAAYHRTTPELQRWWERTIDEVRRTRVLETCLGRRMPFFGSTIDETLFDSIIAFRPQSTLGHHITRVQWQAQSDAKWPQTARIPFNNHDSLTAMCMPRDAEQVAQIMRRYAEAPLMINGEPLIIPAGFKKSVPDERGVHRWSALKEYKA